MTRQTALEQAESAARAEIETHIGQLDAYEFQDLVAALLRGTGYYTPFVAPHGKDSGIDIVAYKDPFGSITPRIKVQVKHRGDKIRVSDLGGFSSEVATEIRRSSKHIKKIDLDELIRLWKHHYERLREEDRLLMPVRNVAFLAPQEE